MIDPDTLTPRIASEITADWKAKLPGLAVYRPLWFLRRVGPLLTGLCLENDRGGDVYKPCFHVHCLCKVFPCVSLTLFSPLLSERSGAPEYIKVQWHQDKWEEACDRMLRQSLLPHSGDVSLPQVLHAYDEYLLTPLGRRQAAILLGDTVRLLAWAGDKETARRRLADCLRLPDAAAFQHVGGRNDFETQCRRLIENPGVIHETVEQQIMALGVQDLPVSRLLC